jgi:hypothetical protein
MHTAQHNPLPGRLPTHAHTTTSPGDARRQNGPQRASHAAWRITVATTARRVYHHMGACIARPARDRGDEIGPQTHAPIPRSTTRTRHPAVTLTCWSWASGWVRGGALEVRRDALAAGARRCCGGEVAGRGG